MSKKINAEDILKNNPHLSEEELAAARAQLRKLREIGAGKRGYRLALPFGGRRAAIDESAVKESSTIHLTRTNR